VQARSDDVEVVLAWHAALNAADTDRLLALSTPDVEVGGPRGAGSGADLLRDWVIRARIQLEPVRWQSGPTTVVVEEKARWATEGGQLTEPQTLASVFRLRDGQVSSVIRFEDFDAALASIAGV
jgi:ketosteroid isomerase-like protein